MKMMLLDKKLKNFLKEVKAANKLRKADEPMIDFALVVKNPSSGYGQPRVLFIEGEAPVSFFELKQAENIINTIQSTTPRVSG